MHQANRNHIKKVALWGGSATVALAAASLIAFPPLFASSVLVGGVLSIFNIYSIVRLVEALTGAAEAGVTPKASKALTMLLHFMKLGFVGAVLVALAVARLVDVFGFLAGFTSVLLANVMFGLSRLGKGAGGPEAGG